MLRVATLVGRATDDAIAERLHELAHRGRVETVRLSRSDMARRRQRLCTDHGTEIALLLDRDAELEHGSVLWLTAEQAVVVALEEPLWLVLRARDVAAALELGYFAGNMHWKVRFDGERLCIAQEGPRADYLQRLAHMLGAGTVVVEPESAAAPAPHDPHDPHPHVHAHHRHDPGH